MSPSSFSRRAVAALALIAAGALGSATAAAQDGPDTTISVAPRVLTAAPADSPVAFPGVSKVRARQPLPGRYAVIARDVRFVRGAQRASAALRMTCPMGKTWRAGAVAGDVGFAVLDRTVSRKRSVVVMASYSAARTAVGQTAAGTVYALCR
jgi:hypothetical protein